MRPKYNKVVMIAPYIQWSSAASTILVIWKFEWVIKTHLRKKGQVKNSHKQLELKNVPFTAMNICWLNVKHSEI